MRPIHLKDSSPRRLSRAFPVARLLVSAGQSRIRRRPVRRAQTNRKVRLISKWDRMKFKAFDLEFTTHVLATGTLTLHFPLSTLPSSPLSVTTGAFHDASPPRGPRGLPVHPSFPRPHHRHRRNRRLPRHRRQTHRPGSRAPPRLSRRRRSRPLRRNPRHSDLPHLLLPRRSKIL